MNQYEIIDHTADWALRVWGRDLTDLFWQAAQGMNELLVGSQTAVARTETRSLQLEAFDIETLLVDWLGELAYWAEADGLVFPQIELQVTADWQLTAVCQGAPAPQLHKHIKAVTYHNLAVRPTATGLEVTIVFDV